MQFKNKPLFIQLHCVATCPFYKPKIKMFPPNAGATIQGFVYHYHITSCFLHRENRFNVLVALLPFYGLSLVQGHPSGGLMTRSEGILKMWPNQSFVMQ